MKSNNQASFKKKYAREKTERLFWSRVNKSATCWLWTGGADNHGYVAAWFNGKNIRAHRLSLTLSGIELIDGLVVDHLCRNRKCVNPAHLRQITLVENILCGEGPCANHLRQTHCKYGHKLSGDNLVRFTKAKRRTCKICKRKQDRKAKTIKKLAQAVNNTSTSTN